MSSSGGLTLNQVAKDSLLRGKRDFYFAPEIAQTAKVVASVDPSSAATVGTALTLATAVSGKMLRRARRPTVSVTDASFVSGSALSVTVQIVGQRFGMDVREQVTATATSGSILTATALNVYDEILSVTPTAITNAASGDALVVGIDGLAFGLDFPIDNVADVQSIINTASNVEAAPTAISSTSVITVATGGSVFGGSFIVVSALAVTDRWEVRYLASVQRDGSGTNGVWR